MTKAISMTVVRRHLGLAVLALVSALGCGAQTYEQRLAETARYFEYRERVDTALDSRPWQSSGIELRPPKGFSELPAPAEGEPDQRQPEFISKPLPGLLGAWKTELQVDIPNSDTPTKPAWMFACSNHRLWLDRETNINIVPSAYHADLNDVLADNFGFKRSNATAPWKFVEERVPKGVPYVPYKSFDYIVLDHNIDQLGGVLYDIILYRYIVKEIQLAIIVVAPQALDRRERLHDKMLLLMEQLSMSGEVPKSAQKKKVTSGGGI